MDRPHALTGDEAGVNVLAGNPERGGRLGRFLLLSLALHASLVLAVLRPAQLSLPTARDAGPLAVRLGAAPVPRRRHSVAPKARASGHRSEHHSTPASAAAHAATTTAPAPRHVVRRASPRSPEPAARSHKTRTQAAPGSRSDGTSQGPADSAHRDWSARPQPAAKASPGTHAKTPRGGRHNATGGVSASAARSRVLVQVRRNLRRYFHYPGIAQRRGWEGRVVLDFAVRGDGRISDVRVARSSGHAVLDHSAVRALRRVGRLDVGSAWPAGGLHNVKLPVIYRLEG